MHHDAPEPLWTQVRDDLRALIESGELPPGQRLPGELALAEVYGVGRITVRHAIRELRDQGRVIISTGKGTFVARES